MRIYVDFDDCLCETARYFTKIAASMFGKNVPYEDIKFFNLQKSFDLNDEEYKQFMLEGHLSESLLAYDETPNASIVLNELMDKGHEVCVITGRPDCTYDDSRRWLDDHGLNRTKLYFLNKYGRDLFFQKGNYNLELEDFYKMDFDYAVEDSPLAFKYLDNFPKLNVLVFDRPWNHECTLQDNYVRCPGWEFIKEQIK
ncbi:MAG: 2-dehydropantoate 2-reductase [Lachnospiraceae bacterium]|nr:2-dehydropantoate 2-reductase [Lachnospiraceae bacterium]